MEIDKLIEKIAEEVYRKVSAETGITIGNTAVAEPKRNSEPSSIVSMVDHTLLKPDATAEQVKKICQEAKEYGFASVCVNPAFIPLVAEMLKGSGVKPCSVIGFPLGATTSRAKAEEVKEVIENGAAEVDMVINIGAAKAGDWDYVKKDIEAVVNAAKGKALVKVIIETCLLSDEEKVKACAVSKLAGADFVKTSTGFSTGGAKVEDIKLMRKVVGPEMGVKASGGVRNIKDAVAMVEAGANRLGTSAGISIAQGSSASAPGASAAMGKCVNCGVCSLNCPTDTIRILKNSY